ncbi:MAG: hypothetical protein V4539_25755 [Bacteroidota bacterium]
MATSTTQSKMRVYHRYLGYFLVGIMAVYSVSGITLIFRDTDFMKRDKHVEKQLAPNLKNEDLVKELRLGKVTIEKEEGNIAFFKQGTYNKTTGVAEYTTKELYPFVAKLTKLHKASTKDPLFFLNVFFGVSLFFFVLSSFWMFLPKTTIFKKGLYFTLAGIVLTVLLLIL